MILQAGRRKLHLFGGMEDYPLLLEHVVRHAPQAEIVDQSQTPPNDVVRFYYEQIFGDGSAGADSSGPESAAQREAEERGVRSYFKWERVGVKGVFLGLMLTQPYFVSSRPWRELEERGREVDATVVDVSRCSCGRHDRVKLAIRDADPRREVCVKLHPGEEAPAIGDTIRARIHPTRDDICRLADQAPRNWRGPLALAWLGSALVAAGVPVIAWRSRRLRAMEPSSRVSRPGGRAA